MYTQPSLWTIVEILSRIDSNLLQRIALSWYKTRPQYHPGYTISNRGPTTCPKCYDAVRSLLDKYMFSQARHSIIEQLMNLQCDCKRQWFEEYHIKPELSLYERIQFNYSIIAKKILGEEWWMEHSADILSDISPMKGFSLL